LVEAIASGGFRHRLEEEPGESLGWLH
jgi:hypothetical protein